MTQDASDARLDDDPYVRNHPQSRPFWRAAATGTFLIPRCVDCGRAHWHPRPFCPFCQSESVAWETASGTGRIHAFTMLRRDKAQNILAYVQLQEGPIMMTNIIDATMEELAIGDAVQVTFRQTEGGRAVPVFRPLLQVEDPVPHDVPVAETDE